MKHIRLFESFKQAGSLGTAFGGTAYHGTTRKFDKFKFNQPASNPLTFGKDHEKAQDSALGIFFTDNWTMAEYFARLTEYDPTKERYVKKKGPGRVVEAEIHIKKPYLIHKDSKGVDVWNDYDPSQLMFDEIKEAGGAKNYKKILENAGYDGIRLTDCQTEYYDDGSYQVLIVFHPDQIENS